MNSEPPFLIFSGTDATSYLNANDLDWTEIGSAEQYRKLVIQRIESANTEWSEPLQPETQNQSHGPWAGFLWEGLLASQERNYRTSVPTLLNLLNSENSVVLFFEAKWLPAYLIRPRLGCFGELSPADAYIIPGSRMWFAAIDHEGYGPFLYRPV